MPDKWDQYASGSGDKWAQYATPVPTSDALTEKTQATTKAAGAPTTAKVPLVTPQKMDPSPFHEAVTDAQSKTRAAIRKNVPFAGAASDALKGFEARNPQAVQGAQVAASALGGGMEAGPMVPPPSPEPVLLPKGNSQNASTARKLAKDLATKYVGKTIGDIILPEPPEPPPTPEDINYERGKSQVEAQEENKKFDTRMAKTREAALNKEGDERMAIEERYQRELDAATKERVRKETAVRKAHDDFAKAKDAIEKARQKGLGDMGRLNDDYSKALKLQADAEAEAGEANKAEDTAKETLEKARAAKPSAGVSGRRPTSSEKYLTQLIKKNIISPDEYGTLRRELGEDAMPRRGEPHAKWVERALGHLRSGRAAQGMADVPSGPSMPPPPTP